MSQEFASGSHLPDEVDGGGEDPSGGAHSDSSSRLEQFGIGVSASILLGAVVGVAATSALEAGAVPLLFALGFGFILSPVVGLLVLKRNE